VVVAEWRPNRARTAFLITDAALAPPTQFDSLVYHLALPQKYILSGKINYVQGNFFFSFPDIPKRGNLVIII
jgi:hypothetical protein